MEIQDKNNILQQMMGSRMFNMSASQSSENIFAEMLNPGKPEKEVSFEEAKRSVEVSVRDKKEPVKTEAAVKEDKKEKVPAKKNDDAVDDSKEKVKNKKSADVPEDKAVAAAPAQTDAAPVQKPAEGNAETPAENAADVAAVADGGSEVLQTIPENLQVVTPLVVPTPAEAVGDVQAAVLPQVQTQVDEAAPLAEAVEQPASSEDTAVSAQLEGEDALLLRQAEYIDKKVNTDGKMKIEVSVQEEKIAAPIEDNVIQNRFEVDALVRKISIGEKAVVQEGETKQPEISGLAGDKAVTANIQADPIENTQLNNAAIPQTTEEKSQVSIEASRLSASGKEMIVEASSAVRNESFARINEASSRDIFKGMGKEAVEQIKVNITKSAVKGVDTIDIQLKPEDLGKIQIKMHISKDGKVQAEIISGRQETLDMLQKEVSGLAKAFEDAGYETDGKSFSFSFQDENQAGRQSEDDSGLLKFIGDALEQEAESAAGNDNVVYNPALGLNIRV